MKLSEAVNMIRDYCSKTECERGGRRMTLREALETIAEYCKRTRCADCPLSVEVASEDNIRYSFCKLEAVSPENWNLLMEETKEEKE